MQEQEGLLLKRSLRYQDSYVSNHFLPLRFFSGFCFGLGWFFFFGGGGCNFFFKDSCTVITKGYIDTIAKHHSAAHGNGF